MKRAWLTGLTWLAALVAAVMLTLMAAPPAQAMPIPFAEREVQLTAREQPIAAFLQDLFGLVDVPVSVSPSVKGAVNGSFSGPAARVWRNIARAFNLVEYYDGAVLHIYSPADMVTRTLPVAPSLAARVQRNVLEMRLPDARNTVRSTEDGTLIVSGTRRFIEQVEEITRAQLVSDRAGPPSGFKVFYLRYAWAQDVSISFGGRQVVLPGVASIVRALMTQQSRSQVAVQSNEVPSSGTVPGLRGQRSQRPMGGSAGAAGQGLGTLGAAQADAGAASLPVLAAAYGAGAGGPGAPGAAPAAGSALPPMAPQALSLAEGAMVRVEADARLNAVIVRDAPDRLAQYEQLVAALDIEPQTLEIEATIIDVNTERLKELGINWRYSRGRSSLLFGRGDASDRGLAPGTAPADITPVGRGGFVSAVLGDAREFIARVNLLEDQGAAKVVSSPQVLTLSNVEAVFDNSSTFYVRVAGREDVDLFNVSAGTTLRVTPHVFKDGGEVRIKMLVSIEDGSLSSTRVVDTLPVVERSAVNTQALIFEGESLLVGGITREASNDGVTKVPGLGDVPVLGGLFRSTSQGNSRVERMFLISPRLSSGRQARAALPPADPAPQALPPPAPAPDVPPPRQP
ncbi:MULTISPECIES: type III secretion system outer membrane ring subunit SctC [Aquincola]|uniref:type III secretion system outer membrane ring subunit SctC n=1 Tax=Aquincola TaxID=391952 RepID=UPI000615241C|nr:MULTISPECIES: type III secretion system outer membrane ring subunit SctC [Aquincola]MCR5867116.1 type III secretion system outer membrane ring subunit SctC [Aquincola sp. J276]